MSPAWRTLAAMLVAPLLGALGICAAVRPIWRVPDSVGRPSPPGPTWYVVGARCPTGCSFDLRVRLSGRLSQPLTMTAHRFDAPFLEPCEGVISFDLHSQTVDALNLGLGEWPRLTPKNLGLHSDSRYGGVVSCRAGDATLPFAQIVSLEPDRMLLLQEEGSILDLRNYGYPPLEDTLERLRRRRRDIPGAAAASPLPPNVSHEI